MGIPRLSAQHHHHPSPQTTQSQCCPLVFPARHVSPQHLLPDDEVLLSCCLCVPNCPEASHSYSFNAQTYVGIILPPRHLLEN